MSRSGPARGGRRTIAFVATGVGLAVSLVHVRVVAALVVPAVFGVLALIVLVHCLADPDQGEPDRRRILRWTLISLVAHLLFGLLVMGLGGLFADVLRGPDSITYNNRAIDLMRHWSEGLPAPSLPAGKEGFYFLLAGLYWLFGAHIVSGLAINATLSAALVPLVTDTTRDLFGPRAARYAVPLVVVLPGMFLWTSQLGKEAAILFFIAVAANGAVRLLRRGSALALLSVMASISLLFTFRGWVALTLLGGVLAGIVLGRPKIIGGVSTGAATTAAIVVLVLTSGIGYSGYQAAMDADLEEANAVRQELAVTGRTGFDEGVDVSTSVAALSYLPKGVARLVVGPFPWQLRGVRQIPGVLEVVVWWTLLPSLWRGLRRGWQVARRRVLVLILPTLTTAAMLSLSIGNYGTQLRERLQVVLLLVPFVALGLAVRQERQALSGAVETSLTMPPRDPAVTAA
jgi:hypothetical protein